MGFPVAEGSPIVCKKVCSKMVRLSDISIDSLRFLIPLRAVEVLDLDLVSRVMLVGEDGEVKGYQAGEPLVRYVLGVKVEYRVVKAAFGFSTRVTCLQLLVNSKMLGRRYFEGITINTVEVLHGEIQRHGVVRFDLDTLLEARCLDVDFKLDTRCDHGKLVDVLLRHTKNEVLSITKRVNKATAKTTHKALYYNDREASNRHKYPYLKIYDKAAQLLYDDTDFLYRHFAPTGGLNAARELVARLVRIEYTIPNARAFKSHGIETTKLGDLLKLPFRLKLKMLLRTMSKYVSLEIMRDTDHPAHSKASDLISPKDLMEITWIKGLLSLHGGRDKAVAYMAIEYANLNGLEVTDWRVRKARSYYSKVFDRHWEYLEASASDLTDYANDLDFLGRTLLGDRSDDLDLFAFL